MAGGAIPTELQLASVLVLMRRCSATSAAVSSRSSVATGAWGVRSIAREADQSESAAALRPTVTRPESTHSQATVEVTSPGATGLENRYPKRVP